MKNFILNFKAGIRFFTSIIISREFAVIYCLLGTISQVSHTYFLIESISSLQGNWRIFQATLLSIFISSSLFYFVAIADKDNSDYDEYKRIQLAINLFTFMEIIINIYYYTRHLLIDMKEYQILDYIFALLVSALIPVTIKLYSSSIRAKEWIIDIETDRAALISASEEKEILEDSSDNFFENLLNEFEEKIDKKIEFLTSLNDENKTPILTIDDVKKEIEIEISKFLENIQSDKIDLEDINNKIDIKISDSFKKQSQLFLNQFENKIKTISNNVLKETK